MRAGTVLIVVAGIAALLAALAIAFLASVRDGAATTEAAVRDAQARLMLHAACAYVLEAGRLGYGPSRAQAVLPANDAPGSGFVRANAGRLMHREAFGWIDAREADGASFPDPSSPGPRDQRGDPVYRPGRWPAVGGTVIGVMHRWRRPPYAILPTVAPNPIVTDPTRRGDADWGRPLQRAPAVQPAVGNGWPGGVTDAGWAAHVRGDATPVPGSTGIAWFRVHRASAATFVVTCGAGATLGFRDWDEVLAWSTIAGAVGGPAAFADDRVLFDELRSRERRMWYEIRWSGAVRPLDFRHEEALWWGRWLQNAFAYRTYPVNGTQYTGWSRANRFNPNPLGTISYIQRLDDDGSQPLDGAGGVPLPAW
ncbi:MAG TPA: hypothetical protein VEL07_02550 [Planctomycetota bacterium]|nr:hypothetical protein [Planctomycetota bacterium]